MGDRSPKAMQKQAGQKQDKTKRVEEQKQREVAAKQAPAAAKKK